jgi:hypothetical protein
MNSLLKEQIERVRQSQQEDKREYISVDDGGIILGIPPMDIVKLVEKVGGLCNGRADQDHS